MGLHFFPPISRPKPRPQRLLTMETGPVDLWAKPLPPSFPRGAFPMPIEQLAIHRGEQAGCDPSGIAMAIFVACAGALSDTIRLKMRIHEPWFERPLLSEMLIGVPSTNKTAMLKCSTARIKENRRRNVSPECSQ